MNLQRSHSLGRARGAALSLLALLSAATAQAHVKWFAPYIVEAPPQQIGRTLENRWFWIGIGLVLVFFLAARAVEKTSLGDRILGGMDTLTGPLWRRLDDFVLFVIAAFFVAVFAVGGVYLTPDLKTPDEWVSWMQLVIAGLVFSRRTRPLAAAGILGLWLLALTEYEFFHLLDYLALGVAVAAYLVLQSSHREHWRHYRFVVLRWGVAIALMWSSLEKFAYPEWFYPLVEEKPFLTFGMPRDVFIPMAGVAEFTMGFGLLWTALVRRLSALALFVIFNAAVWPFGRMDLVGHALIMAVIVAIFADPMPQVRFAIRRPLWSIPPALAAALLVFAGSYWSLHALLYAPGVALSVASTPQGTEQTADEHATHGHTTAVAGAGPSDPHATHGGVPHEPAAGNSAPGPAQSAYQASMDRMHRAMAEGVQDADADAAFIRGMLAHHEAAIDMARIQLRYGKEPGARQLAQDILREQQREVRLMERWLQERGADQSASSGLGSAK